MLPSFWYLREVNIHASKLSYKAAIPPLDGIEAEVLCHTQGAILMVPATVLPELPTHSKNPSGPPAYQY